jgi:hypothetical protein
MAGLLLIQIKDALRGIGTREGEGAIGRVQIIGTTAQAIVSAEVRLKISPESA